MLEMSALGGDWLYSNPKENTGAVLADSLHFSGWSFHLGKTRFLPMFIVDSEVTRRECTRVGITCASCPPASARNSPWAIAGTMLRFKCGIRRLISLKCTVMCTMVVGRRAGCGRLTHVGLMPHVPGARLRVRWEFLGIFACWVSLLWSIAFSPISVPCYGIRAGKRERSVIAF